MFVTREKEDYADIVNMARPEPKNHRRMPMIKRAAQLAPFAALRVSFGLEQALPH